MQCHLRPAAINPCEEAASAKLPAILLFILSLLMISGCAGTTTFIAYPDKINPLIADLQTRKSIDFTRCFLSECKSSDMILYNMERGRIAQIVGNTDASMRDFAVSMDVIREKEQKAIVSASDIGAQAASVAVNDNAIPYEGAGYERVMLHQFQAMNYLSKNDLEGAGVEIRRANFEQEEALKRHGDELDEARKVAEEKRLENPQQVDAIKSQFSQLDEAAGKVKNSFQNAYTFYLSGFVYELTNQQNDAYIDYKKALEIFPENTVLQRDVIRLAGILEMNQDLEDFKNRFDPGPATGVAVAEKNAGELLVLFEDGFAPQKQEVKIYIPVPRAGLIAAAFPIYRSGWTSARPLLVTSGKEVVGSTETICDIRALAVKSLQEKIPVLAIRQTIRAVAKGVAAKRADEKFGALGFFGATLWNLVSETADLRSWITLPEDAQIMRVTLPAGMHKLTLQHEGSRAEADIDVNIKPGGKTILRVVRAGDVLYNAVLVF